MGEVTEGPHPMTDIEALRARMREAYEAATQGPWEPRDARDLHAPASCIDFAVICPAAGKETARVWTENDAHFIALASPANVKALDAEITRLREDLEWVTRERDEAQERETCAKLEHAAAEAALAKRDEEVARLRDFGQTALDTAERILDYLGIGYEASKEPGADRRRDLIASWIDKATETRAANVKEPTNAE